MLEKVKKWCIKLLFLYIHTESSQGSILDVDPSTIQVLWKFVSVVFCAILLKNQPTNEHRQKRPSLAVSAVEKKDLSHHHRLLFEEIKCSKGLIII